MPVDPETSDIESCREAALRLLDRRAHTRDELRRKLRQRRFGGAAVTAALDQLQDAGLIDDYRFALDYCDYRLNACGGYGRHRVVAELRRRGVAGTIIDAALDTFETGDNDDAELERATDAARKKWVSARRNADPLKARGRVYRFLVTRGFSADVCRRVVEQLTDD